MSFPAGWLIKTEGQPSFFHNYSGDMMANTNPVLIPVGECKWL
jgi:hypothetical protein